jgi:hypothetical protein
VRLASKFTRDCPFSVACQTLTPDWLHPASLGQPDCEQIYFLGLGIGLVCDGGGGIGVLSSTG